MLPKRLSSPLPSLVAYQRASSLNRVGAELKMRWFVHVLARLAIAATCTSSAAALDARVSAANTLPPLLWEHLMLNSSGSLNGVARRYGVPSRELRVALRDNSSTLHENGAWAPRLDLADVKSPPVTMPTMTRAEGQKAAPWSPLFTSFIEGFALYGASYGCYGALLNAIATSFVESCPTEASAPQPEEISPCERREFISFVSPAASPGATAPERETSYNWLARPLRAITSRWAHWLRHPE